VSRRLNYRLLLITLAVLGVFAVAFHALHLWQAGRNVTSLLAYAREAKKEKKIDQALSLYEQYLKLVPKDLDVQEEFARELDEVSESPQDRGRVVTLYETLLLKSGERPQTRMRLVENLIHLGRYEAAARHLEILRPSWPDRAELEHKRAWCLDAEGKYEAAVQGYARAVEADPKRIPAWLLMAEILHQRLSRDVDAQQAFDKMVAANETSAAAWLARFRYRRMLGHDVEAEKDLAEARRLAPEDADVILAACQWAQSKGNDAEARRLAAKGAELFPANEAFIKERASLEFRQGHRDLALQVIEDGLKALGNKTRTGELQIFRADLLIDAGKPKEAAAIIAALRHDGLAPALPDFLQARLFVTEKKWSQAQGLLEKSRPALAADPYWSSRVNALLGVCFGQLGDGDRQIAALLDAVRAEPRWAALNLSIGQAYLDADNPEQALLYLQPLLDDAEAPRGAHTLLARVRYRLAMQLPEKRRHWKDVDDAVAQAQRLDPDALDVALLRADVLQAQHKVDAARSLLMLEAKERSAKTLPEDLAVWLARADLESRVGDFEAAESVLQEAQKRFGDRVGIRLGYARVFVQRGRNDDRAAMTALADSAKGFTPDERGRLCRELAELWLRQGDHAAARTLLARAATDLPRDLRCRALLIDLDLQESKLDDARRWLKEMQALEGPNGKQSAFAALYVRVEEAFGQPDDLRKILAELKNSPLRRGDDGRIDLVESRIYERLGDGENSLNKLRAAVSAGQRSSRVMQRFVRLITERQEYDQLAWAISLIEGRGPLPREVGRASIEAALAARNLNQARDLLGPVDVDAVRDYRELLWLGRIYKAMNDSFLAERSLRRAVAVAPHATDAWIALADFLVRAGKRSHTDELVADIDRHAPPRNRPVIRARVLQALGRIEDAHYAHEAALKSRPKDFLVVVDAADFYRQLDMPLRAEPLYKKALDPSLATPPEIAARARRGLALALSAASPAKAAEVLEGNRGRNDIVDERLALYLSGLDPARRAATIRDFEAALARGPASPEEAFWFVQLLDAAGRTDAVAERLAPILAEDKDTPQMLAFYARSLLRQGKTDEARPIVQRLVDREPGSPRSRELQAKIGDKSK
jgi:tetratricopeptide (TPR) repeat protein